MTKIRLLPVVVMAIAALLVLKTLGLVLNGGYVLNGVGVAQASGAAAADQGAEGGEGETATEPTAQDTSPTMTDTDPTLANAAGAGAEGGHGAPGLDGEHADAGAPAVSSGTYCIEADAAIAADGTVVMNPASAAATGDQGQAEAGASEDEVAAESSSAGEAAPANGPSLPPPDFAASMTDCLPNGDAVPVQIDGLGGSVPLLGTDGTSLSEQQLLERLATRRTALEKYEQDLALRASIVDAAEKRIEERAKTLEAMEAQISSLVDQRTEMESGQFAGIVAMYETMKPKDAALIFNNLDMEVLLRVAKTMSPRKMAPILAAMDTGRAQELTVKMAALADKPSTEMTPEDLAALPQIVGQ